MKIETTLQDNLVLRQALKTYKKIYVDGGINLNGKLSNHIEKKIKEIDTLIEKLDFESSNYIANLGGKNNAK